MINKYIETPKAFYLEDYSAKAFKIYFNPFELDSGKMDDELGYFPKSMEIHGSINSELFIDKLRSQLGNTYYKAELINEIAIIESNK